MERNKNLERIITKSYLRWVVGTPTHTLIRDAVMLGFEEGEKYGEEQGLTVDREEYERLMEQARVTSRRTSASVRSS